MTGPTRDPGATATVDKESADLVLIRASVGSPRQVDVYVLDDPVSGTAHLPAAESLDADDDPESIVRRVLRNQLGVERPWVYSWSYAGTLFDRSSAEAGLVCHYALIVPGANIEFGGGRWVAADKLPRPFDELQLPLLCDALLAGAAPVAHPLPTRVYDGVASQSERLLQGQAIDFDLVQGLSRRPDLVAELDAQQERYDPLSFWQPKIAEAGHLYWQQYYEGC